MSKYANIVRRLRDAQTQGGATALRRDPPLFVDTIAFLDSAAQAHQRWRPVMSELVGWGIKTADGHWLVYASKIRADAIASAISAEATPLYTRPSPDTAAQGGQVEALARYPDPFDSIYSEEESQANALAAAQRAAFEAGVQWSRTPSPEAARPGEVERLREALVRLADPLLIPIKSVGKPAVMKIIQEMSRIAKEALSPGDWADG